MAFRVRASDRGTRAEKQDYRRKLQDILLD
jgi:hypothetical protein